MSSLPVTKNITYIDSAVITSYNVKDNDDVINVDSRNGQVTINLINISSSNLPFYDKPIIINDVTGFAAINPIKIVATNDKINGYPEIYLDSAFGSVQCILANNNSWIGTFGVFQTKNDAFKVLVSSLDTLPKFLSEKLIAGSGINLSINSVLGVEELLISSTASGTIIANTVFVSENGNDATAQINNWGAPFKTIAAANAAIISSSVVFVMPGTYVETTNWCQTNNVYYLCANTEVSTNKAFIDDANVLSNFTILGYGTLKSTDVGCINARNKDTQIKIEANTISATGTSRYLFNINCATDIQVDDLLYNIAVPPSAVAAVKFSADSSGQIKAQKINISNKKFIDFASANKIIIEAISVLNTNFSTQMAINGTGQFVFLVQKATFTSVYAIDAPVFSLSSGAAMLFIGEMVVQNSIFGITKGQLDIQNSNIRSNVGKCIIASGAGVSNVFVQNSWLVSSNNVNIELSDSGPIVNVFNSQLKVSSGIANANITLLNRFPTLKLASVILDTSGANSISCSFNPSSIRVLINCIANKVPNAATTNAITGTSIIVDALAVVTPPNIY